jgi:hypothetical protein
MSVVVRWNGKDVPTELRAPPEGLYVLESLDAAPALSQDSARVFVEDYAI